MEDHSITFDQKVQSYHDNMQFLRWNQYWKRFFKFLYIWCYIKLRNVYKSVIQPKIAIKLMKMCPFHCQLPYYDSHVYRQDFKMADFTRTHLAFPCNKAVFSVYNIPLNNTQEWSRDKIKRWCRLVTGFDRKIHLEFKEPRKRSYILKVGVQNIELYQYIIKSIDGTHQIGKKYNVTEPYIFVSLPWWTGQWNARQNMMHFRLVSPCSMEIVSEKKNQMNQWLG